MRFAPGLILILLSTGGGLPQAVEQVQAPFRTLLPWSLGRHEMEIAGGLTYRQGAVPPFYADDRSTKRDEWRLTLVDLTYGLGGGSEARIQFGVQDFTEQGGLETTGIEDARLTFAWQASTSKRLAVTGAMEVKLPNASDDERLGTDQTDLQFTASLGHSRPRWGWAGEAGLGILGHPLEPGTQDDVLVFGGAGWWRPGKRPVQLIGEIEGIAGSRFDNNVQTAGLGLLAGRGLPIGLMLRRGLNDESPDWSATMTVTFVPRVRVGSP